MGCLKIDVKEQIAPHFYDTFMSFYPHQIDAGGRASTKSSKNPLKCLIHMINDPKCNVVVIKQAYNTIRQSVFQEFKRACRRLGLVENVHYTCRTSPFKITLKDTGNSIYFGGLSDYEALKGMIPDNDTIKIAYLSEITQFKSADDIDQINATFSRGNDDYYMAIYEYNPPRNKYHWVNVWKEKMARRKDVQITHTDYRGVPRKWLGKKFLQEATMMAKLDPDRYNWIYLGLVTGLDGLVYDFENVVEIKELQAGERILSIDIGIDTGHMTSSTAYLAVGLSNKGRLILLDTYFYSPSGKSKKKPPSEFSKDLKHFEQTLYDKYRCSIDKRIIDSAEGGIRNQYYSDYGIRLKGVAKETTEEMFDHPQELFSLGKFCVLDTENNKIFILEHRHVEWKEGSVEAGKPVVDKTERKITDKLDKIYYNSNSKDYAHYYADHTCDAFKYLVCMCLRKYGLKQ